MSTVVINRLLLVSMVVLVLLAWIVRRDVTQPNYHFTPEMVFSIPYDSLAANPIFPDGKTQQLPVAGTIARGAEVFDYLNTEEDALRAGRELQNPWKGSDLDVDALLAAQGRGRKVYVSFCLPCHGAVGNGDGPVSMHGFPPPPSLSLPHSLEMRDGQMFHVITFGQKNMPAYAAQVPAEDRWKVILHLRALQEPARLAAEQAQVTAASIESGRQLYEQLGCQKCHTVSVEQKPVGPYLGRVAAAYDRQLLWEAVKHPSKTIANGYLAEVFLMFDGKTHSGFVTGETDAEVTIRNADGNEIVLPIDDIDERRTLEKSPMPDGLIDDLSSEQLDSLLDYLQSLADESAPLPADGQLEKQRSGDNMADE